MKRAVTAKRRERIRAEIVKLLSGGRALFRREINTALASILGLRGEELSDNAPNGKRNLLFSAIGTLLSDLCREGVLQRSEEGRYLLLCDACVAVQESRCREEILAFTETARKKEEIYLHLEAVLGTDKTPTAADDRALRSLAGTLLVRLLDEGELVREGEGYRRVVPTEESFSEDDEEGLCLAYLALLHRQGGPFLERFAVSLLSEYYGRTDRRVVLAEVTGGARDGGIDGRIDTVDSLGFSESILLQTKCRRSGLPVTETEVRGFYGAVCAAGGSRGIFVTTSHFHEGARRFLDALPNCVGIDGRRLFEIAKKCGFGLRRTKEGLALDRRVFSESV